MLSRIEFKKDLKVLVFSALLTIVVGALVGHGDVSWKEGSAFLIAALGLPGLFGVKNVPCEPVPPTVVVTPDESKKDS